MKKLVVILLSTFLIVCIIGQGTFSESSYRLDSGDILRVSVFGYPDLALEAMVSPDGTIGTAFDSVKVGGLTLPETTKAIKDLYSEYIREPKVSVNIVTYRTGKVKVLGGVMKPAIYSFPAYKAPTVSEVIALAGGFSEKANSKIVYIMKGNEDGTNMIVKNFHELLMLNGSGGPLLEDGDVLYVPENEGGVLVLGEVARPGQYLLTKDMKVIDAVAQAGGPIQGARLERATLTRYVNGSREVINLPLDELLASSGGEKGNMELQDGDLIYIPMDNRVTFSEAVSVLSAVKLMKDIMGW